MRFQLTLLTAGLAGSLLLAGPLPAAGPAELESASAAYEYGRIDGVNVKDRIVIISDSAFALAPDARIHSASGATVPMISLRRGMRIAFVPKASIGPGTRIIAELMIRSDK